MDGVSAAASVVSLVTIAGQLIQSIKALHEFWSSVEDVPTRLRWLSEDLQFLQQTLKQVEQYAIRDPSVSEDIDGRQALERCAFYIAKLEALIGPMQPRPGESKKVVLWKSIKAVFRVEKIELYRGYLEAAKATILLALTILNRESILNVESTVAKLLTGQSAAMHTAADDHTSVLRAISSLQYDVQTTMASLALKTDDALASVTTTSLENTIWPVLERKLEEYLPRSEMARLIWLQVSGSGERAEEPMIKGRTENSLVSPIVSRFHDRSALKVKRRRSVLWKKIPTPFGYVLLSCDVITQNWTASGPCDGHCVFEYGFTFFPRQLFSRWTTLATGIWRSVPSHGLSGLSIQFHPIVSSDSAIFTACRAGDVGKMENLFQSNQASPRAVNEKGEDLLQILKHALEAPAPVRLKTCKFLLRAGCRSATSIEGYNPLDKVMSRWTPDDLKFDLTNPTAALDCDLEVMRLLVEKGRLERMNCRKLLIGLTLSSLIGLPYEPPALEYLCKQQFFVFSLSTAIASIISEDGEVDRDHKICELRSCLRALLACGDDEMAPHDSEMNALMFAALVKLLTMETFNNREEQKAGFNTVVLVLSLSLRYGIKPNCKLSAGGYLDTASRLANSDPDFMAVAWRLALKFNELALQDHESIDQRNSEIDISKATQDQMDVKVGNISKDDEEVRPVPGAWIEEEPKPRNQTQIRRKFQSVPDDFNSIIRGRLWDRRLYSKLGT